MNLRPNDYPEKFIVKSLSFSRFLVISEIRAVKPSFPTNEHLSINEAFNLLDQQSKCQEEKKNTL